MSNPLIQLKILIDDGMQFVGFCKNKLRELKSLREQLKLPAVKKTFVIKAPVTKKGRRPIKITAIILTSLYNDSITILGARYYGFMFTPRYGPFGTTTTYGHGGHWHYRSGGEQTGVILESSGWDCRKTPPTWVPLNTSQFFHPANLGVGRLITKLSNDDQKPWEYNGCPPQGYGILDWKGKGIFDPAVEDKTTCHVLTWTGPPSRYFCWYPFAPEAHAGEYFGYKVYEGAEVIAEIDQFYLEKRITGAAITVDSQGNEWKVITTYTKSAVDSRRCEFNVLVQPYESECKKMYDVEDYPDGWREICKYNPHLDTFSENIVPSCPFFFNGSGTEASGVFILQIYTVTVDIDNLSATVVKTNNNYGGYTVDHFRENTEWNETAAGTNRHTYTYSVPDTIIAIDYIEDTKVYAKLNFEGTEVYECFWHACILNSIKSTWYDRHYKKEGSSTGTVSLNNQDPICITTNSISYASEDCELGDPPEAHEDTRIPFSVEYKSIVSHTRSLIAFMDLRHNILVWVTTDSDTCIPLLNEDGTHTLHISSPKYTNSHNLEYLPCWDSPCCVSSYFDETEGEYKSTQEMGTGERWWPTISDFWFWSGGDAGNGTVPSKNDCLANGFYYTNNYYGSFAVDRWGNHFYSYMADTSLHHYLSGVEDPAAFIREKIGKEDTQYDNITFFPIVPV